MKRHVQALGAVFVVLLFSCDRDRDNPIDPNSSLLLLRPLTPSGLAAEGGTGLIFLSWEPLADKDLAGYAIYRADIPDGSYEFIPGNTGSERAITTGKTSYIDSINVHPGSTLFYRIAAVDIDGFVSTQSPFVGVTVKEDKVPPGAPQNFSAMADEGGESRVLLRWSAPLEDADGNELGDLSRYVLLRSEGSTGSFVVVDTVGADTLSYTDENLKELTVYEYVVLALDEVGNTGRRHAPVMVRTGGLDAPSRLQVESQIGQITLSWSASQAEELLGYNVYRSPRSDGLYVLLEGEGGDRFTTGQLTYIDSNLTVGDQFFYKVSAVSSASESEAAVFVEATVRKDDAAPASAENVLVLTDSTRTDRLTVSWSAPVQDADGGTLTGLSGYVVLRSEGGNTSFVEVARVGADALIYEDNGLEPLTLYVYAVMAFDGVGNESALAVGCEARTGGVVVPGGLLARGEIGRIVLTWLDSAEESLLGYNLYRSTVSDGVYERLGLEAASFTTGQTSYVDEDVVVGTDYYYKVTAVVSGGGESSTSVFVEATGLSDEVGPGVPQDLSAAVSQDLIGQIVLRWTAPVQDADGGELTGLDKYVVLRLQEGVGALVGVATLSADFLEAVGGILGIGVVEYVDRGLDPLTVYDYSVIAIDAAGNESSQALAVRVQSSGIEVPVGLQAVGGIGRVTLTWQASEEEDLLGYKVYRATSSDGDYEFLPGDGGTFSIGLTTFVDGELTSDAVLFYRVAVVTTRGESQQSAFVGAQVQ